MEFIKIFFDLTQNNIPVFVWIIFAFMAGFYCGKNFHKLFKTPQGNEKIYTLDCNVFFQDTPLAHKIEKLTPSLHFENDKFVLNTCRYSIQKGKICSLTNEPCKLFDRINV